MAVDYATLAVVPAIPPTPPQVTLLGSAILPDDTAEPTSAAPLPEQLSELPSDLRAELSAREGEMWVRGFQYAPENHGQASVFDRCDFTSPALPILPAPSGVVATPVTGTGTLTAATYHYQVTAVNGNGETTAVASVAAVLSLTGEVVVTWTKVEDFMEEAYGVQYRIYGRSGTLGLLATVGPFTDAQAATWTDDGSATPGVAVPISNTTGGASSYGNPTIVQNIPFLVVTEDSCSAFGWSERDFKGRALRWLENATPQALEREFWRGDLAQLKGYPNNWLTNVNSVVDLTPGTVPSVTRGTQILQDALQQAGFGGQGMIHTQAQTAPNLLGARRVGKLLLDVFDNIVVPGVGYDGSAPGGAQPAAGTAWMYATDLVAVRTQKEGTVFPDTFAEAFDWGQNGYPNTITFRAERFAAAYWDGQAHFGCLVNLAT